MNNRVGHFPVQVKNATFGVIKRKPLGVIMNMDDISLSSLRVAFVLRLICKKRVLLSECSPNDASFLIDCSNLN